MKHNLQLTKTAINTPKMSDGRLPFHPILMMHASHLSGFSYEKFMTDYKCLVESNLRCLELYDHDAVSVISDPNRETSAFGANIIFSGNSSPKAEKLIYTASDVNSLKCPNVYECERTMDRIKGVELFRNELGKSFPIIGWVEGPLAECCDLMTMSDAFVTMFTDPQMIHDLCEKCLQTAMDFAKAQIDSGANIIGVGDAVCSQISLEQYIDFGYNYHKRLFDYIHKQGALVKLHICGNITHLLEYIAREDVDILDADWMVDMKNAYNVMGNDVMICGNIDPVSVILEGSRDDIMKKYDEIKNDVPNDNWIVMAGCEIPMDTPVKNVQFLRKISYK